MIRITCLFLFIATTPLLAQKTNADLKKSMDSGKALYETQCISCHMENGEGMEDVYPPLAKSDYLMADKVRSIRVILEGVSGPMKVNGKTYDSEMQAYPMSDTEVIDLVNYIRNSFGNKGGFVTAADVAAARKK